MGRGFCEADVLADWCFGLLIFSPAKIVALGRGVVAFEKSLGKEWEDMERAKMN